jgi:hypothetical protein
MSQPVWRFAITLMRHAVGLWDAVNASSSTLLHPLIPERVERIRDEEGDRAFYLTPPDLTALRLELGFLPPDFVERGYQDHATIWDTWATGPIEPHLAQLVPVGNLRAVALLWLRAEINRQLLGHVKPQLAYVSSERREGALQFRLAPVDVWGAMWLDLAREIETVGGRPVERRTCQACGKPFDVGPDRKRAHAKFCDDRCRRAAQDRKIRHARALARRGQTVTSIAKALGCQPVTVRGWLKNSPRRSH